MTELEWITCELQGISIEDIFKLLIRTDGAGNFWLNTNQYQQRAGIEAVVAAGTDIVFSTPMDNADYVLVYRCYNAADENLEVEIPQANKTANGFRAIPFELGTLEYFVTEQI